ncbi:dihydrofolate reductase [Thermochromatium tepidum]|uniref:Dihydrofolate reductase n=1 Tax=Thermochromatium tepidum ATCC 43061 TaxID=316276 RepID=A0A6I6E4T6_THETI|nr:dihydrofolate reductase [Thermochromatium tepidum]QGU31673.1 dihydrofolate reductase [Thermochromatium tepidum ATCC 43061]
MPTAPLIALVAAMDLECTIGRDNALPWHLPADLAHFKALTLDKPILMGRKTWESLPGRLPRRRHLILSRDPGYSAPGCEVFGSLEAAIAAVAEPELMIIGGASIYAQSLPLADRLHLTIVQTRVAGDARFPAWDPGEWQEVARLQRPADEYNRFDMTFVDLVRRSRVNPDLASDSPGRGSGSVPMARDRGGAP